MAANLANKQYARTTTTSLLATENDFEYDLNCNERIKNRDKFHKLKNLVFSFLLPKAFFCLQKKKKKRGGEIFKICTVCIS